MDSKLIDVNVCQLSVNTMVKKAEKAKIQIQQK